MCMPAFILAYHRPLVSHSHKYLGFLPMRSLVLHFLVSFTMFSQAVSYLTILPLLLLMLWCYSASSSRKLSQGKKSKRCSLCHKTKIITFHQVVQYCQCSKKKCVLERKYTKVEKLGAEWDSPVTS